MIRGSLADYQMRLSLEQKLAFNGSEMPRRVPAFPIQTERYSSKGVSLVNSSNGTAFPRKEKLIEACASREARHRPHIPTQAMRINECLLSINPRIYALLSPGAKAVFLKLDGSSPDHYCEQDNEARCAHNAAAAFFKNDETPSSLLDLSAVGFGEATFNRTAFGLQKLRRFWRTQIQTCLSEGEEKAQLSYPIVTCGKQHGVFTFASLFADKYTHVILPDILYDSYSSVFAQHECFISSYPFFTYVPTDEAALGGGGGGVSASFNIQSLFKTVNERLESKSYKKTIVLFQFGSGDVGYSIDNSEAKVLRDLFYRQCEQLENIIVLVVDEFLSPVFEPNAGKSVFKALFECHHGLMVAKVDEVVPSGMGISQRLAFLTYAMKGVSREAYDILESKTAALIQAAIAHNYEDCMTRWETILCSQKEEYCRIIEEYNLLLKKRRDQLISFMNNNSIFGLSFDLLPFNSGYCCLLKPKAKCPTQKPKAQLCSSLLEAPEPMMHSFELSQRLCSVMCERGYGIATLGGYLKLAMCATSTNVLEDLLHMLVKEYQRL
eukprot:Nk52_evm11s859 gene=Nk52_evmTU11s859